MVYGLLVLLAVMTLFLPMPRWLSLLLTLAFVGIGIILLLFGLAGNYWSSHLNPSNAGSGTSTLVTGVLLLLSRAGLVIKLLLGASTAPDLDR